MTKKTDNRGNAAEPNRGRDGDAPDHLGGAGGDKHSPQGGPDGSSKRPAQGAHPTPGASGDGDRQGLEKRNPGGSPLSD